MFLKNGSNLVAPVCQPSTKQWRVITPGASTVNQPSALLKKPKNVWILIIIMKYNMLSVIIGLKLNRILNSQCFASGSEFRVYLIRIRNQVPDRIQGLQKRVKMLNNNKIIYFSKHYIFSMTSLKGKI